MTDRLAESIKADREARRLARTYTLTVEGGRPLTINAVAAMHRQQWATHTRVTRMTWLVAARNAKVPRLERAHIEVTPLHANGRSPQDVGACAAHSKAAVDGLVDAGVFPDDNPNHVLSILFLPPRICGIDGMELTIREAP